MKIIFNDIFTHNKATKQIFVYFYKIKKYLYEL